MVDKVDRGDRVVVDTGAEDAAAAASATAAEVAAAEAAAAAVADAAKTGEPTAEELKVLEAAQAAETAAAAERDTRGRFIPKDRFNEAVAKERTAREVAERRIVELEKAQTQVSRGADITAMEKDITTLRIAQQRATMAGEEEKSVLLATDIARLERQIVIQQTSEVSAQDKEAAREEIRVEMAVEKLEAAYPELDEKSDKYDGDLVQMVLAQQNYLIQSQRMMPSAALNAAATTVMKRFGAQAAAAQETPKGLSAAAKAEADRKAAAVAKGIADSKKQPPNVSDVGTDSDKKGVEGNVDVTKLSFNEFAALPEETKKRMRGDLS